MVWFRRRKDAPEPLDARLEESTRVEPGARTVLAAEAVRLTRPLAAQVDPQVTLGGVVGHGVDADGRAHHWECLFDGRGVLASIEVELVLDDRPTARLVADPKLPGDSGSLMRTLWGRLDASGRAVYLAEWFSREPLPHHLDSAAAMRSFAEVGFELEAGPTDAVLSTRTTDDGACWELRVGRDGATRPLT